MDINFQQLIQEALEASLGELEGQQRALFFSGGFDSMLLAWLMRDCGAKVTALTVQFDGFNQRTVNDSMALARKMGLPHHILNVSLDEFFAVLKFLPAVFAQPVFDLDLVVVYAALKKYDPVVAGKVFVSGMGSDQLFGDEDLAQLEGDLERHCQAAEFHGYTMIFPFLSDQMRDLSQRLSAAERKDKKLLRSLVPAQQRRLVSKTAGKREIQVPVPVRRLVVKMCSGGKVSAADPATLHQVIERFWLKKRGDQVQSG